MPTYIFKCRKCGDLEDRSCSVEEKDKQLCKVCEGKLELIVEKKLHTIAYRERPEVRQWRKEKGV